MAFDALLAGEPVDESSPTRPIRLEHQEIVEVTLLMSNVSNQPVTVSHARLEGELLGLIFLTYDTGINVLLQPGDERVVRFPIDFFDLEGQAHGLLRGQLTLYDADRTTLAATPVVVDGRGRVTATMTMFNLLLALVAAVSLGWNLHRMSLGRLPANRVLRGLRFVHSGVAVGLTLAAASSTLRIWPLSTAGWIVVLVVTGVAGFVAGVVSPGPDDDDRLPIINLRPAMTPVATTDLQLRPPAMVDLSLGGGEPPRGHVAPGGEGPPVGVGPVLPPPGPPPPEVRSNEPILPVDPDPDPDALLADEDDAPTQPVIRLDDGSAALDLGSAAPAERD